MLRSTTPQCAIDVRMLIIISVMRRVGETRQFYLSFILCLVSAKCFCPKIMGKTYIKLVSVRLPVSTVTNKMAAIMNNCFCKLRIIAILY